MILCSGLASNLRLHRRSPLRVLPSEQRLKQLVHGDMVEQDVSLSRVLRFLILHFVADLRMTK